MTDQDYNKLKLKEYLNILLSQPISDVTKVCECCDNKVPLIKNNEVISKCILSDSIITRYKCSNCLTVFGPMQIISLTQEELDELYRMVYSVVSDGNSVGGQERTFYNTIENYTQKILNFACGPWSAELVRLRALGWNLYGYEPFQKNSSEFVFSTYSEIPNDFDCQFTSNYFEHVQSLNNFFTTCNTLTKKNATIVHQTPCFSYCFDFSPLHLQLISDKGFELLCRKHNLRIEKKIDSNMEDEMIGYRYMCRVLKKIN